MKTQHSLLIAFGIILAGCAAVAPINPSFPVTSQNAQKLLDDAAAHPKPLERPLVIVSGFMDPGISAAILNHAFGEYTRDKRIISVALDFGLDEEEFRRRIISAVDKAFPSNDPKLTTEVDVIGVSMGGLAARYAAMAQPTGRRLNIHRLFTLSSPHRGALTATQIPIHLAEIQTQMTPGSTFLNRINSDPDAMYPIYAYVCLNDDVVGTHNAAPPSQSPWWVACPAMISPHLWVAEDSRIRADILRRLHDETPLSSDPPAPLPAESRNSIGLTNSTG
jgi:pimeloyl-ACP methyl ester carboxylesterase